jgi:hypothetical protein
MAATRIRWGFVLFALVAIVFVLWAIGPDLKSLIVIFFLADLVFGISAIAYGGSRGRPGVIVGGALCLLMTFGSFVPEPGPGTLVLQILAGVVGLGPVVVTAASKVLD